MIYRTCALFLLAVAPIRAQRPPTPGIVAIRIITQLGTIDAELDSAHAPITVTNFLRYVDGHYYDAGAFCRAVTPSNQPKDSIRIEVIQGGMTRGASSRRYDAIPLERTNVTGLHHGDGTLSMARSGPNTATESFFITIGEQSALDFGGMRNPDGQGFAAFGRITSGADVVRAIQRQPVKAQSLVEPVTIIRIERR